MQIYECRASGDSIEAEWTFVAPEADLYDEQGRPAGKHFAGPSWDAGDGSRIAGTTQASVTAPRPDSIPWLLLNTHSVGGAGRFAAVTSVQRIETAGGTAPDAGCTTARIGRTVRDSVRCGLRDVLERDHHVDRRGGQGEPDLARERRTAELARCGHPIAPGRMGQMTGLRGAADVRSVARG